MSDFRVRPARASDSQALMAMIDRFEEGEHWLTAPLLHRHALGPDAALDFLIAEHRGQAIGFAALHPNYNTDRMVRSAYLSDLYLEPKARGHGQGRKLIAAAATYAAARFDARAMDWAVLRKNKRAIGFYRHLGAHLQPELFFGLAYGENFARLTSMPLTRYSLRAAGAGDALPLGRYIDALLQATDGQAPLGSAAALLRDGLGRADQPFRCWIAERDGVSLGHVLYWPSFDIKYGVYGGFVSDLYVAPEARRGGLAEALMAKAAQDIAGEDGVYLFWQILESNWTARSFYRRFAIEMREALPVAIDETQFAGFVEIGRAVLDHGD